MVAAAPAAVVLVRGHDPAFVARADAACLKWENLLVNPPGDVGGGDVGDPRYDAAWVRVFDRYSLVLHGLRPAGAADRREWALALAQLPEIRRRERAMTRAVERHRTTAVILRALVAYAQPWKVAHRRALAAGARDCFSID